MSFGPDELGGRFEAMWGAPPAGLVRAPGRVNLIGEHIDYCGLAVLPMALDRAVWLAFRPNGLEAVRMATTEPGLDPCRFAARPPIPPGPAGDWGNYARAAVASAAAGASTGVAGTVDEAPDTWCGFDALVDSTLPIAAGLGSSSALVVATALAALRANRPRASRVTPTWEGEARLALAERVAEGERYVGTAGGGMDQAACLLGRAGHALRIEFEPLRVAPIPLPASWRVVVAHSGERAEKSGAAQAVYNRRTDEARGALTTMRTALGADPAAGYAQLLGECGSEALLAVGREALEGPLHARFRHIVGEADRVDRFETALRASDLDVAGTLLLASHASLRDDYEVSTPRLDALVERALEYGAVGARLTGAGLGGCILALCEARAAPGLCDALAGPVEDASTFAFIATAAAGAEVKEV